MMTGRAVERLRGLADATGARLLLRLKRGEHDV